MGMHLCRYLYMFVDVSVFVFGAQMSGTHLFRVFFQKNREFRPQMTPSVPVEITIVEIQRCFELRKA